MRLVFPQWGLPSRDLLSTKAFRTMHYFFLLFENLQIITPSCIIRQKNSLTYGTVCRLRFSMKRRSSLEPRQQPVLITSCWKGSRCLIFFFQKQAKYTLFVRVYCYVKTATRSHVTFAFQTVVFVAVVVKLPFLVQDCFGLYIISI